MSIKNVASLFKEIDQNENLRSTLNACTTKEELIHCMQMNHLDFSMDEFEDAINMMHVNCQTFEAALELFSKANWFIFLFYSLKN